MTLPPSEGTGGGGKGTSIDPSFEPHVWQKRASRSFSLAPQFGQISLASSIGSTIKRLRIPQATGSLNANYIMWHTSSRAGTRKQPLLHPLPAAHFSHAIVAPEPQKSAVDARLKSVFSLTLVKPGRYDST
jgi:hypothetical protein